MSNLLNREQIIDLIENVLDSSIYSPSKVKENIQFCCTVHGETKPSAGIKIDTNIYHCFSCHETGTLGWLMYKSLDHIKSVQQADEFLRDRYNLDVIDLNDLATKDVKRYEDFDTSTREEVRFELPIFKIAPFKSGKETYKYFYDRGFTSEDVKKFKIGRDLINETVTIPLFWEDGKLAGIIGRYIDKNRPHNQRYKIYEETPTGSILYPLDKLEVVDDTIILVEGILDALYMHTLGYTNTLALLTNNLSKAQAKIVRKNATKVIDFTDGDKMGYVATNSINNKLKGMSIYSVKELYVDGAKDPCDLNPEEVNYMIENKVSSMLKKPIVRL